MMPFISSQSSPCNAIMFRCKAQIPQETRKLPLTLMADLQIKDAEWHDIWTGCMLQRAILYRAWSMQPLGADSDPCCAMAQTAQALPVAFTSPSPADGPQLTGHPCYGASVFTVPSHCAGGDAEMGIISGRSMSVSCGPAKCRTQC